MLAHDHARDRLIAATIGVPRSDAFYFDYDLLRCHPRRMLWAKELSESKQRRPLARVDRVCLFGWVGLYLWTFFNPPLAGECRRRDGDLPRDPRRPVWSGEP